MITPKWTSTMPPDWWISAAASTISARPTETRLRRVPGNSRTCTATKATVGSATRRKAPHCPVAQATASEIAPSTQTNFRNSRSASAASSSR